MLLFGGRELARWMAVGSWFVGSFTATRQRDREEILPSIAAGPRRRASAVTCKTHVGGRGEVAIRHAGVELSYRYRRNCVERCTRRLEGCVSARASARMVQNDEETGPKGSRSRSTAFLHVRAPVRPPFVLSTVSSLSFAHATTDLPRKLESSSLE